MVKAGLCRLMTGGNNKGGLCRQMTRRYIAPPSNDPEDR